MKTLKWLIAKFRNVFSAILRMDETLRRLELSTNRALDELKVGHGLMMIELNRTKASTHLSDYEFKVFSQWGEDGIIQRLTSVVPIKNKTFMEFGVEDFRESNCRFLMTNNNWRGFVIDGSAENVGRIKQSDFYWKYDLQAVCAFITRDNIDALLRQSGFEEDVGILSVDLDGNDYHVLEAITYFKPRILVCEYNAVFGTRSISVPYAADFERMTKHHSSLYCGASLTAITHLASLKGFALVGVNSASNNAFFVRRELMNDKLVALTAEEAYRPSLFRESRSPTGQLTHVGGQDRLRLIEGMPVLNVESGAPETL